MFNKNDWSRQVSEGWKKSSDVSRMLAYRWFVQ
jgi:hypothetical protein